MTSRYSSFITFCTPYKEDLSVKRHLAVTNYKENLKDFYRNQKDVGL